MTDAPAMKLTRRYKQFGMVWIGNVADEADFRARLEKRGYHVVEVKQRKLESDNRVALTAWCIYIRNLPKECQEVAKQMKGFPKTGDTVHWEILK